MANNFSIPSYLGTDLDTIRACFSEKEKELSIAVSKVEALTRQLEELRRGRRGFGLTAPQDGSNQQPPHTTVTRELEKLRRELMVSVKWKCKVSKMRYVLRSS